jgi:threonine dehydrogenase-like Zn-dependent dehydrogenase
MRAAVLRSPKAVELASVDLPKPGRGCVRVRVESCGVCSSNLPPWEGRPWFTYPLAPGALGHEATGCVDAIGEGVEGWQTGERVALMSQKSYAEYDVASVEDLVRLPAELDGRPFPGEPLGCAMNIFERAQVPAGATVAIVGTGFLGCLLVQLARGQGCRVLALGRRAWAQKMAAELGAETVPWGEHWQSVAAVREATGGRFCDVVFEVTGKQEPLHLASELTREMGRLIIAGYHQDGLREVNLQLWGWRGLDVINAHERDPARYIDGIRRAIAATLKGVLNPFPLITHTLPLAELGRALQLTHDRPDGFMKAVVVP